MKKILLTLLCAFVAACSPKAPDLNGAYKMLNAPENAEITLRIDGNRFSGQAAINNYFGNLKQDGTSSKFEVIGSTMMAGPEELMIVESNYLADLGKVDALEIKGDHLILRNNDGLALTFEKQK